MGLVEFCAKCVSPTVSKVLACKSLEGEMAGGRDVDNDSPDAVMASCSNGISRSMRSSRLLTSRMMPKDSCVRASWRLLLFLFTCDWDSWEIAISSSCCPKEAISRWRALTKGSAESKKTLPRPDLRRISSVSIKMRCHQHLLELDKINSWRYDLRKG